MEGRNGNRRRGRQIGATVAAALIAGMAVVLAAVLLEVGLLDGLDGGVRRWFGGLAGADGLAELPRWPVWLVLAPGLFGLAWAIIESPGCWRRLVLWVSSGAVVVAATPVAAIAGGWLGPGAPAVGWLWSGAWAIAYGMRHEVELEQARRQRGRASAPAARPG